MEEAKKSVGGKMKGETVRKRQNQEMGFGVAHDCKS